MVPYRSKPDLLHNFTKTALIFVAAMLPGCAHTTFANQTDCLNTETALQYWRPIRENPAATDVPTDELAIKLLSCLGSPDPELRDRIGYELFATWLRDEMLTDDTRRTLLCELSTMMSVASETTPGNATFARSFSALVLSEVVRSDSLTPFMSADDRQALLDLAIESIRREKDYRGLDAELGWVHPVAHMSDLLWRFALHPETSEAQAESILDAIRSKVAPTSAFYTFNESDRLARVITTVIQRKTIAPTRVAAWLGTFETPLSTEKWSDAFASPQGMTELHNTKLFLRALSDQLDGAGVDPRIIKPLSALVRSFTQLI